MKGRSKWSLFLSLVFVFSLFLSACSNGGSSKSSTSSGTGSGNGNKGSAGTQKLASKQVINLAYSSDIPGLDSSLVTDLTSFQLLYMIHGGLATVYNGKAVPDLALKPKVSNNGTVYTFKIRKGAKWSNGDPVTAQDFVFAWRRTVDPKTKSQYAYIYASANIKNAAKIDDSNSPLYGKVDKLGIKALNSNTLQITLSKPTPYFYSLMSFPSFFAQNKKFVESKGKKYAAEPSDLLYDGAYKMTSWNHGQGWTLVKNPDYWDAKNITIDKVNAKVVKTEATQLKLYQSGKLSTVTLTSDYVNKYKNQPEFHEALGTCVFYMKYNMNKIKPFKDVNVRRALSMAVNRKGLANVILNNGAIPAHSWVPSKFTKGPQGKFFNVNINQQKDPYVYYNLSKAKQLWKQAKKKDHFNKLNVTMLITDDSVEARMGQYLQAQLQKLPGLKVTLSKQPWGNYLKLVSSPNGFELGSGSSWCPDYQDPMTFLNLWVKGNPHNTGGFDNPKYNQLIQKASSLGDQPQKRWKILEQVNNMVMNELPIAPLYQLGSAYLVKPNIKNLQAPSYGPMTDYRHAKVYQSK